MLGIEQQPQVAARAGLALADQLADLGHRQLAAAEQQREAQAGRLGDAREAC